MVSPLILDLNAKKKKKNIRANLVLWMDTKWQKITARVDPVKATGAPAGPFARTTGPYAQPCEMDGFRRTGDYSVFIQKLFFVIVGAKPAVRGSISNSSSHLEISSSHSHTHTHTFRSIAYKYSINRIYCAPCVFIICNARVRSIHYIYLHELLCGTRRVFFFQKSPVPYNKIFSIQQRCVYGHERAEICLFMKRYPERMTNGLRLLLFIAVLFTVIGHEDVCVRVRVCVLKTYCVL